MALTKKFLKSKPVCKVTFKLTQEEAKSAESVQLIGEFNEWDAKASPMKKLKSGGFTQTIDLEAGKEFRFRYLLDGETWENDWAADKYIPSESSYDDDSVVSTAQ